MRASKQPAVYPDHLSIEEARSRFLAWNGFRSEDYTAGTYTIKLLGIPLTLRNTKDHQWATPLHDLHHVLTGFGTDWIGEGEVAIWELRAGCKTAIVYWLDLSGAVIGLLLSPARMWRAFRAARGQRTLYRNPALCERLLQLSVGELRASLGIPAGGISSSEGKVSVGAGNVNGR